jgi:hypothetical protein
VDQSRTARDCLRGGLFGALAATAFSGALAGALLSSAPSISPSLSSARTPAVNLAASAKKATITLSPSSGPVGTVVTMTGKGFVPKPAEMGQAGVTWLSGVGVSATPRIGKNGTFTLKVKVVKDLKAGSNGLEVNEQYSCTTGVDGYCVATAQATFTVAN